MSGGSSFVGQGPGNTEADSQTKWFYCNVAFAVGEIATLVVGQGFDSYKVNKADQAAGQYHTVGVAKEAISAGEWGEFYVKGYCPKVLSGGSVSGADYLIPSTTAGTAESGTVGTNDGWFFGVALSADSGTPIYCSAYLDCLGS